MRLARTVLLALLGMAFLAPLAWMVNASLKAEGEAVVSPVAPPEVARWENYGAALRQMGAFDDSGPYAGFLQLAANTLLITALSIAFQILTCSLAGYAFARLRFRGRDVLFVLVLAAMMLPAQALVIPQFVLFQQLGWIDTFLPLLVPCLLGGSPFFIFLFRQSFLTIPRDVVEAARLDGCGAFGVYLRVMLPLSRPVVATVAIFTFLAAWNDLWTPLIYLSSPENQTLTLALAGFSRTYRVAVEHLMAASTIVLLPCVVVYFLAQKTLVRGVQLSATKG
ncbi:MAG: carbohydrate ABC transporter permease [Planctomycetota bacterium]